VDANNPSGSAQVLQESATLGGTPTLTYTLGASVFAQTNPTGTSTYLLPDGRGSIRLTTDSNGNLTGRYDYDAFGNALNFNPASAATKYLYEDQQYDSTLGQYYMRARDYIPALARFSAGDSYIAAPGDLGNANLYTYVANNAANGSDRSGHEFDLASVLSAVGDIGASVGQRVVGVYRAYRAVDSLEQAFVFGGSIVSGIENVTTGPRSLAPTYRFLIGFIGGVIQGEIALRAPTIASAVGTTLVDTANVTFSHERWSWATFKEVVVHVVVTAGVTGVISAPVAKLFGETNIEGFLISADVSFVSDDVKGFAGFWKDLRI
jgi:RHS repeat-associated protein